MESNSSVIPQSFEKQLVRYYTQLRTADFYNETSVRDSIEAGSVKGLCQIHHYLFNGLSPESGKLRTKEIGQGFYRFINPAYLKSVIPILDAAPFKTSDEIIEKFFQMVLLHPFSDGNGRCIRIMLDIMLMRSLHKRVNWGNTTHALYTWALKKSGTEKKYIHGFIKKLLVPENDLKCDFRFKQNNKTFGYEGSTTIKRGKEASGVFLLNFDLPCDENLFLSFEKNKVNALIHIEGLEI